MQTRSASYFVFVVYITMEMKEKAAISVNLKS